VAQPDDVLAAVRTISPGTKALHVVATGLSGANAAFTEEPPELFLKWPGRGDLDTARELAREAENLARVSGLPGIAQLVHYDPGLALLLTERVRPDPAAVWDDRAWELATHTLRALRRTPTDGLGRVSDWKAFRDRGPQTLAALRESTHGDDALSHRLLRCYDTARTFPPAGVCHGDCHPGNWLLTPAGPTLVDFGHMAAGPAGFDEAFLLAHLEAPAHTRLAWLEKADVDMAVAAAVVGACAARLAVGRGSDSARWREWCDARWPVAVSLATALGL
jgi:aminoglycoside phosphotransferase (APT) family kinase protein